MLDPHKEIQALVDNFVADLGDLAKRIAIEQVKTAFGGARLALAPMALASTASRLAGGGPPHSRSHSASQSQSRSQSHAGDGGGAGLARRGGRARRGQREIEALRGKVLAAISERPGRRAEDINSMLGTRTPEIAQLLRRLVADQLVRTEGARRGTRYFAMAPSDAPSGRRPVEPAPAEEPATA